MTNKNSETSSSKEAGASKSKVFWTSSERHRFARALVHIENTQTFSSWSKLVDQSCSKLISEGLMAEPRRRRWTPGFLTAPVMKEAIERERELYKQASSAAPAPLPAQPPTPYDLLVKAGRQLIKDILSSPAEGGAQANQHPSLGSLYLNPLIEALIPEVRKAVREEIEAILGAGGSSAVEAPSPVLQSPREGAPLSSTPKRKVLVVGLLGKQAEEVSRSFGSSLDLRFLSQEDSITRIVQNAKNCDVSLGLVGYMGHHVDQALNKHSVDYHRCNGTVSDVKRVLSTFAGH